MTKGHVLARAPNGSSPSGEKRILPYIFTLKLIYQIFKISDEEKIYLLKRLISTIVTVENLLFAEQKVLK